MSSHNLTTELLKKMGASRHAVISFVRTFLNEVICLGFCAGRGVSGTLLTLAVLTILFAGDHSLAPPPPVPF